MGGRPSEYEIELRKLRAQERIADELETLNKTISVIAEAKELAEKLKTSREKLTAAIEAATPNPET